jgi:HK97 family phage major capsid protein
VSSEEQYLQRAWELIETAELRGGLEPEEREELAGALKSAKALRDVDELGRQIGAAGFAADQAADSPGARFVSSAGYKALFGEGGNRGERWSIPPVDVTGPMFKGTLGEGGAPAQGGQALVSIPSLVPGAVTTLFQPLSIESLLLSQQTDAPTVRYVVEGTATNAATGVAEAGTKPESTLGLTTTDESVKKIATILPVSEELLEDAGGIQAFINGRLSLFVNLAAETQIFRGAAGGATVQGLLTSRSIPVYTGGTADTKAEQLFKAMNSMRGSAFVEPDWICIHPSDYQIIRLLKDTANQYLGGGPFLGAYGNPTMVDASGQVTGATDHLWGKPVYVTASVGGSGTALVGTRANAAIWNRGGLRVEASNSHSNYFVQNLVAIRAERRLALTLYRAGGFCEVRLAVGPGG